MKLMDDLLGDLAVGAHLGINKDVGLAIEGTAGGEEFLDFFFRIRFVKEGAMRVTADALENCIWRGPEANNEGVGFETGEIGRVNRQAAPGSDDGAFAPSQFFNDTAFPLAKSGFAVLLENIGNGFAGTRFDDPVSVQKGEVEDIRNYAANGGFAGSHKADEGQIVYGTRVDHCVDIADLAGIRTQILRG
jgi:hypothetical protein